MFIIFNSHKTYFVHSLCSWITHEFDRYRLLINLLCQGQRQIKTLWTTTFKQQDLQDRRLKPSVPRTHRYAASYVMRVVFVVQILQIFGSTCVLSTVQTEDIFVRNPVVGNGFPDYRWVRPIRHTTEWSTNGRGHVNSAAFCWVTSGRSRGTWVNFTATPWPPCAAYAICTRASYRPLSTTSATDTVLRPRH